MIPSLVERWLIAITLEQGRPLPVWLRRRAEKSPELRRYIAALGKIDSALLDPGSAPLFGPGNGLALRISEALARPSSSARRSLPLGWLGGAMVATAVIVVVVVATRLGPENTDRATAFSPTIPTIPSEIRRGPIVGAVGSLEGPLTERLQGLTAQTRRSVSGFIRGLPGLPVGEPNQSRLN